MTARGNETAERTAFIFFASLLNAQSIAVLLQADFVLKSEANSETRYHEAIRELTMYIASGVIAELASRQRFSDRELEVYRQNLKALHIDICGSPVADGDDYEALWTDYWNSYTAIKRKSVCELHWPDVQFIDPSMVSKQIYDAAEAAVAAVGQQAATLDTDALIKANDRLETAIKRWDDGRAVESEAADD